MAEEGLKIRIGADVQQAVASLNTLNTSLNKTTQTAANVGTAGMNQLTKGTNQANFALVNFSRVASDAPFGLIGIANNIDPLVQSFVSLRKETGSGKAALSALAASLTGGGGLILGISLVTSALQFAQLGLSRWGSSAKKAKEETDKLKQSQQELVRDISKQRLEIESLALAAKNLSLSENDRANAIDRLNKIIPDNIGLINKQNIATLEGEEILKSYIKAVEAKATAELLSGRIAENNVKLFDNRNQALEATAGFEEQINNLRSQQNELYAKGRFEQAASLGIQIENIKKQNESAKSGEKFRKIAEEILAENEKLRKGYQRLIPTVNTLSVANDKAQKQSKGNTNELIDLLKRYNEELKGINWDEQNRQIDGTKKRLELAGETLRTLYLAGVKETSSAWIQVKSDFDKFQSAYDAFLRDQRLKEINEGVSELRKNIGSFSEKELAKGQENTIKGLQKVGTQFLASYNLQQKGLKDLQKKNEELAGTISNILSPALEGVFESIIQGEDPFEALQNSVKQLVIQLGRAVIQSLILKAVTSAIGGPAAGGVAGQALGLGTIRGDAFSFLLSRGR